MLSVVIPTLNAERDLPETLTSLVEAVVNGVVREVIVADGGSTDKTLEIAEEMGANIVRCAPGRGQQLAAGAQAAKFPWLLFLHGDTQLDVGWEHDVVAFIKGLSKERDDPVAAAFTYKLNDRAVAARLMEGIVGLRCWLFGLPYGDQGLLIHRQHYDDVGGFNALPLMEDVDMVRRIGRNRLKMLPANAVTSARRYKKGGYLLRPLRNMVLLSLYFLRVPPRVLAKLYG